MAKYHLDWHSVGDALTSSGPLIIGIGILSLIAVAIGLTDSSPLNWTRYGFGSIGVGFAFVLIGRAIKRKAS